jgi:prepilin-type N-terminal cleavage/methylation domain-containing protein
MPYTKTKAVREARRRRAEEVQKNSETSKMSLEKRMELQLEHHGGSKEYWKLVKKIEQRDAVQQQPQAEATVQKAEKLTKDQKRKLKQGEQQEKYGTPKGFTLIELMLVISLGGIFIGGMVLVAMLLMAIF